MVGRRWPGISRALARVRWPLAGLAALVVILACVLVIPQWLVRLELGAQVHTLSAADKAKAINDVRTTLLQGIGGAVILLGAYFTYRQLQTSREQLQTAQQGQVTERFTRAIEQLGHAELDVRLGGIYALERIANDSPNDRTAIAEVLTAFVRSHAPWPPKRPGQYRAGAPIEQVPELRLRAPDVQAALTVLAYRQPLPRLRGRLDLEGTDLRKARLEHANLQDAVLVNANLQEAILLGAKLQGAILYYANLQAAHLSDANLQGAKLDGAKLQGAHLNGADLQKADLTGADLQQAQFHNAQMQGALVGVANLQGAMLYRAQLQWASFASSNLQGANLVDTNLQRATLFGAKLQGALISGADLRGALLETAQLQEATFIRAQLQGAFLSRAQLNNARADPETTWPDGFDPHEAGIVPLHPRPGPEQAKSE
jgi:uncharacterized protein YjbI with pentapeptide repeats